MKVLHSLKREESSPTARYLLFLDNTTTSLLIYIGIVCIGCHISTIYLIPDTCVMCLVLDLLGVFFPKIFSEYRPTTLITVNMYLIELNFTQMCPLHCLLKQIQMIIIHKTYIGACNWMCLFTLFPVRSSGDPNLLQCFC